MKGHNGSRSVYDVFQLQDGRICSYSRDYHIDIWSIETGQCDITIRVYNECANYVIQLMDGRLCTKSIDKYLRVLSLDTGECELCIDTVLYSPIKKR